MGLHASHAILSANLVYPQITVSPAKTETARYLQRGESVIANQISTRMMKRKTPFLASLVQISVSLAIPSPFALNANPNPN